MNLKIEPPSPSGPFPAPDTGSPGRNSSPAYNTPLGRIAMPSQANVPKADRLTIFVEGSPFSSTTVPSARSAMV